MLDETTARIDGTEGRQFIKDLVYGTIEFADESDAQIAPLLEGWTLERLPTIDRIVLRMSVFELNHLPETPAPVVINEAVELAKKFSTEDSGRFINGVLSKATRGA
jgi:N utilization substance protein B